MMKLELVHSYPYLIFSLFCHALISMYCFVARFTGRAQLTSFFFFPWLLDLILSHCKYIL
uniref:Uncharacterized protein n=1 Tax=Rhizophora mucronata TaxID=61149 RepID=A0A2P2NRE0_RHIMU